MLTKTILATFLIFGFVAFCPAQEKPVQKEPTAEPVELEVLKASVGVWDAVIEVWPEGRDSPSIKFKGVETNRAYGKYWIASDFDSKFQGQAMKVHSIVGFDLDLKKMVGKVIDAGPYAASMVGDYDEKTKTVVWTTKVKDANGKPVVQKTSVTQKGADERLLVLSVQGKHETNFAEFMQIKFVRRKK